MEALSEELLVRVVSQLPSHLIGLVGGTDQTRNHGASSFVRTLSLRVGIPASLRQFAQLKCCVMLLHCDSTFAIALTVTLLKQLCTRVWALRGGSESLATKSLQIMLRRYGLGSERTCCLY